ncbi:chemotaxis protein CheW [Candidatus Nitrospira salsa]|nr:MAG: chemotaxis protein CheW [Nitrospirales bacterium]
MKPETQQFCTFKVNDWSFGVDVRDVQEVIRDQVMTNVPLASDVICGLMNLRGQVVTVLDLRRRFELNDSSLDRSPMNVVIRIDREFISLLVEEIGEVVKVPDEAIEPPPSTIDKKVRRFISGVYRFDNHMLQILDLEKIINLSHNQKMLA